MYKVVTEYSASIIGLSTSTPTSPTVSIDNLTKLTVGLVIEHQPRLYVKCFTVQRIVLRVTRQCSYVFNSHERVALSSRTGKHKLNNHIGVKKTVVNGETDSGAGTGGQVGQMTPQKFTWYFDPQIFWKEIFSGTQVS